MYKFEECREEAIRLYNDGFGMYSISDKLNVGVGTIRRALGNIKMRTIKESKLLYEKRVREELDRKYKDIILKLYTEDKLSAQKIENITGISETRIYNMLNRYNIKIDYNKPLRKNEDYFENLDSEDHWYWVGFILADGNISRNLYTLSLNLNIKDVYHLYKLYSKFDFGRITISDKFDKRTNKIYKRASLDINSKKICHDLNNVGVFPNKTFNIPASIIDKIQKPYMSSFVRGYADGDGHIHPERFSIVSGSKEFLEKIRDIISENCNISKLDVKNHGSDRVFCIVWGGRNNAKKIHEYLYDNSTVHLERKKNVKVSYGRPRILWTNEEIDNLKLFDKKSILDKEKVSEHFPNRTFEAVYSKYYNMKTKQLNI